MTVKSLNHLRVVIHINDGDYEGYDERYEQERNYGCTNSNRTCGTGLKCNLTGHMMVPPSPPIRTLHSLSNDSVGGNMKAEVLLIDDKTLQLNLLSNDDEGPYTNISNKMHFDHVCHATIDMMKLELAIVMDEMLLKHNNTGIIRFSTSFGTDINIFFELFVTFINKRIYHQKYKLHFVKLECLDIGSCLGNTKNPPQERGFALRASNSSTSVGMSRNVQNQFQNTRDMLLWLLNEYRKKYNDSKGHEKLQFTFSIEDHQENEFKVKLTLFNIHLELMNSVERNHWHHYMDHMGDGCQGQDCNFVHSGLTISLSGLFEGIASKNTLLLFDVPTDIDMVGDTVEMLEMAYTVMKNRKKKESTIINRINLDRRVSLSSTDCSKCSSPLVAEELNKSERHSSLPMLIDNNSNCFNMTDNSYATKDFNTLSTWYRKIDERFANTCSMREKYYHRFFELHIKQITSNIHSMFNSMESLYFQQTEDDHKELQRNELELHELFDRYQSIRSVFRHLSVDIKDSEYEELLQIYLETKVFDLSNHFVNLKRKHLDLCQQHLKFTFHNISSKFSSEFD